MSHVQCSIYNIPIFNIQYSYNKCLKYFELKCKIPLSHLIIIIELDCSSLFGKAFELKTEKSAEKFRKLIKGDVKLFQRQTPNHLASY